MPKYQTFFNNLTTIVYTLDTNVVKATIGDSINNNRSLTVNQVIRFLINGSNRKNVTLGKNLQTIYNLVRSDIVDNRLSLRTDAVDINEFINFYSLDVIGSGFSRSAISRSLAA